MAQKEEKGRVFFVRVPENERKIIEAAIKLKYGRVDGFISAFVRRAMLLYARQVIKKARKSEA